MNNKNKVIEKELKKELGSSYIFKLMKYFLPYKHIAALCVLFIVLSLFILYFITY